MADYNIPPTVQGTDSKASTEGASYGAYRYQVGELIGGRFHVHERTRGGFGEVYLCFDTKEEYFYALKTFRLTEKALQDSQTMNRIKQEVDAWIALGGHECIVQCFGLDFFDNVPFLLLEWIASDGRIDTLYKNHYKDRPMFLDWYARLGVRGLSYRAKRGVMPTIPGDTLFHWIQSYRTLPLARCLEVTRDVVQGLIHAQHVHKGFVHGDVKPGNVLVAEDGRAKVSDFGTAQIARALVPHDTKIGTHLYMAPELFDGQKATTQSDIYALGCMLFEMLTGTSPFGTYLSAEEELHRAHKETPIPSLLTHIPREVRVVLARCLEKQADERFGSLEALDKALSGLLPQYIQPEQWVSSARPISPQGVEEFNREGVTYTGVEKFKEAFECFEKAIAVDPLYPNTYTNRGAAYHIQGRDEEAFADYAQAVRLGRDEINAVVRNNRGLLYLEQREFSRAVRDFERALSSDPTYPSARINLASAQFLLGNYEVALRLLDDVLANTPRHAVALYNKGCILDVQGKPLEAFEAYTMAISCNPSFAKSYRNRAHILYARGEHERAQDDEKRYIQITSSYFPSYPEGIHLLLPEPQFLNTGSMKDEMMAPFRTQVLEKNRLEELLQLQERRENRMPRRAVVHVNAVSYATRIHSTVQMRQALGERLTQVTLSIRILQGDNLQDPIPNISSCEAVLDAEVMAMMEGAGILTLFDLSHSTLVLESDHPDDPDFPVRIYNVM